MKIVIAPDSFKGSLSAAEAAGAMAKAIRQIDGEISVVSKPMADGGEGTMEALLTATTGKRVPVTCTGPIGEKINTYYARIGTDTAIIENASIAGLIQVPESSRNPDFTTSFGIGEVIKHALDQGCTSFIIGLGGSATNDGGLGMLMALGMEAWDENGKKLGAFGQDLLNVDRISMDKLDVRLTSVAIRVASDVDNPLCGPRGATYVYGPQKGALERQLAPYDNAMSKYGKLLESELKRNFMDQPGAGAAGGLGFAFLSLGAQLVSGAKLLADAIEVENEIQDASLVLTGEGQSDEQTLYGKAPGYIAELAQKHGVPVILISGSLSGDLTKLQTRFAGCFSIVNKPMPLQECMANAEPLLIEQTKQIINVIKRISNLKGE
ncbi:glycerate kinase [Planococcus lenghuensis]|uniref:Glycerate kinase n=1 Tax=Planococcus lenghuensis TaxID=2213202 RepID=A0A1Q2KW13_9BACL|nr:glycerate kinase [Planococcus lenghuensis]AQQ52390.1 glycerate kinase [Planococcus lenghuensis]